jgi:hypothetical protein
VWACTLSNCEASCILHLTIFVNHAMISSAWPDRLPAVSTLCVRGEGCGQTVEPQGLSSVVLPDMSGSSLCPDRLRTSPRGSVGSDKSSPAPSIPNTVRGRFLNVTTQHVISFLPAQWSRMSITGTLVVTQHCHED